MVVQSQRLTRNRNEVASELTVGDFVLFDKHDELLLQETAIIDFKLVVVHHLEIFHPLIKSNLIIPSEPHVDRTSALSRCSL